MNTTIKKPFSRKVIAIIVALAMMIGMMPATISASYADAAKDSSFLKTITDFMNTGSVTIGKGSDALVIKTNLTEFEATGTMKLAISGITPTNSAKVKDFIDILIKFNPNDLKTYPPKEILFGESDNEAWDPVKDKKEIDWIKIYLGVGQLGSKMLQDVSVAGNLNTDAYMAIAAVLKYIASDGKLETMHITSSTEPPLAAVQYFEKKSNFTTDQIRVIQSLAFDLKLPDTTLSKRFAKALMNLGAASATLADKKTNKIILEAGNINTPLSTIYLKKGSKASLPVVVTKKSGKTKYTSDNKVVATVAGNGKIKAKNIGTAIITITNGNAKKKIIVHVKAKATKLKKVLATVNKTYKVGETANIKISLKSKKATYQKITFKSSNKKVVKVDKAGTIKALKKGKAKITIKMGKKTVKKTITVK
jgi:uncharacterized protein YjdB